MKKIIEEKEGEGFEKLLGERITVFAANYIYTGKHSVDFMLPNGLKQIVNSEIGRAHV